MFAYEKKYHIKQEIYLRKVINMETLFLDYENCLINLQKDIGIYNFYNAEPGGANQQKALSCIRYAIENVLQWDVEEAVLKFDEYMIRVMKLERLADFIVYPKEVPKRSPRYILSLIYPNRVHLNYQDLVLNIYKDVLAHKIQFPREYFVGAEGFYRFCICLQYLITHYHPVRNIFELYDFVSSPEGKEFLTINRLKIPADQLEIHIYDCIHELTREDPNCDLYYYLYQFNEQMTAIEKARAAETSASS